MITIKKGSIIGIIGQVGAGKGTIIDIIRNLTNNPMQATWGNTNILNFGDNLKKVLSIMFNIKLEYFYDRKCKDELYYNIRSRTFISKTEDENSKTYTFVDHLRLNNINNRFYIYYNGLFKYIDIVNDPFVCIKLRELLQLFGTNLCKTLFGKNIWVNSTLTNYKIDMVNIIGDIRFQEEIDAIKDIAPEVHIIKIVNTNSICKKYDHPSENILNLDADISFVWDGNDINYLVNLIKSNIKYEDS
jgi:hypothetical protein